MPPVIERPHQSFPHDAFGFFGELFASTRRADRQRLMEFDDDIDRTGCEGLPKVWNKLHVSVPSIGGTRFAPHWNAVTRDIADTDRLDLHILETLFLFS